MPASALQAIGRGLRLAALCAAAAAPRVVAAGDLTFEVAFATRGEPAALHYVAAYTSGGAVHRVEVWRDGDRRVRRCTDDAVETYGSHAPGEAEFRLSVLDLRRRIHTQVDRSGLYHLGRFTDWFDLTHALRHPQGAYRLTRAAVPRGAPAALDRCDWYALTQGDRTTHVCWSRRDRVPLLIVADGAAVWRITSLNRGPIPAGTFDVRDQGFVRNDAGADIEQD